LGSDQHGISFLLIESNRHAPHVLLKLHRDVKGEEGVDLFLQVRR